MATLADVARLAGVTAATVSNVLSGRVVVRDATRQRVLAAIATTGYRPNLVARGLARGQTFTLALLVPSLVNPFYAEVVEAMEAVADARDHQLLLALSHGDPAQGARHLDRLASRWVDGFIIMGGAAPTAEVLRLAATGKPIVLSVWGIDADTLAVPRVEIDFKRAGELATHHLLDQGHRRIAIILELPVQQTRLAGYEQALASASIAPHAPYLRLGDSSFASGYREMLALLALPQPPTAVFAGNDAMALGAMEALTASGYEIPTDVAVMGVDDVEQAEHAHPPLTTIRIPKRDLAHIAIELALRSGNEPGEHTPHLLAPSLIRRQST